MRQERWPRRRRHRRSAALHFRSAVAHLHGRRSQQLPDAAAGGSAAEDLRRPEEPADRRADLSRLREGFGSRLDRHGPVQREAAGGLGLLVYFSNLVYREPQTGTFAAFNFDQRHDTHRPDDSDAWATRRRPTTRVRSSAASRSSSITAGTIRRCSRRTVPQYYDAGREGERRSREDAEFLPAVHGAGRGALLAAALARRTSAASASRFHPCATPCTTCRRRLNSWVERGTAPTQFIGTKFTDNAASDENRAAAAAAVSLSDRAALQGQRQSERCGELRLRASVAGLLLHHRRLPPFNTIAAYAHVTRAATAAEARTSPT